MNHQRRISKNVSSFMHTSFDLPFIHLASSIGKGARYNNDCIRSSRVKRAMLLPAHKSNGLGSWKYYIGSEGVFLPFLHEGAVVLSCKLLTMLIGPFARNDSPAFRSIPLFLFQKQRFKPVVSN